MAKISKAAIDLIVAEEVSSKAAYEKRYRSTEWPGASSGVTIGIGYDVGQNTEAQFRKDWDGVIPDRMIDALAQTCGITGVAARPHAARLKGMIDVPWDAAVEVFERRTLPRYIALTERALPNDDKLSEDSRGALVSLVFNRGASFGKDGDSYREMRAIKQHMANEDFGKIPAEFRSMKRLWPDLAGLRKRRDKEAALFAAGLMDRPEPESPPPPDVEPPEEKPAKKPWLRRVLEGMGLGTILGGVSIGGVKFEVDDMFIFALCVLIVVVAAVYWFFVHRNGKR